MKWQDKLTASERKHLQQTYAQVPPLYLILLDQRKTTCPCFQCVALLARLGVKL